MQTQHGHVHSHPPTSHVHTCINTRTRPPRKHTHASTLAKSINGKHIHQHSHPPTSHAHKCINTTNASGTTLDAYAHTCINTMNASHAHTWTHMHNAYAHSTCMGNAHAHTHTTHTHTAHAQRICTHMGAHAQRIRTQHMHGQCTCTYAHNAYAHSTCTTMHTHGRTCPTHMHTCTHRTCTTRLRFLLGFVWEVCGGRVSADFFFSGRGGPGAWQTLHCHPLLSRQWNLFWLLRAASRMRVPHPSPRRRRPLLAGKTESVVLYVSSQSAMERIVRLTKEHMTRSTERPCSLMLASSQ